MTNPPDAPLRKRRRLPRKGPTPGKKRRRMAHEIVEAHLEELNQAERVVRKFGGMVQLIRALERAGHKVSRATVYRWTWSQSRGGTGGIIPASALPRVMQAARREGILLDEKDLDPRPNVVRLTHAEMKLRHEEKKHEDYLRGRRELRAEKERLIQEMMDILS